MQSISYRGDVIDITLNGRNRQINQTAEMHQTCVKSTKNSARFKIYVLGKTMTAKSTNSMGTTMIMVSLIANRNGTLATAQEIIRHMP